MSTTSPTPPTRELESVVAVVTGGSRGIGFAIASGLVSKGARVVITGRDERQLGAAAARLSPAVSVHAVRSDARVAADAARAVATAVERFGGLDVLINNAGVGIFGNIADMSTADWQQCIETNLNGVFYHCHAAIPYLRKRGGGWIINISSLAGKNAFVGGAAYCASKAALNAFSEALMQEVRYDNIRVSYIMPGSVSTEFAGRGDSGKADWKIAPADIASLVLDLIAFPQRSLPSRIELRPSRPQK